MAFESALAVRYCCVVIHIQANKNIVIPENTLCVSPHSTSPHSIGSMACCIWMEYDTSERPKHPHTKKTKSAYGNTQKTKIKKKYTIQQHQQPKPSTWIRDQTRQLVKWLAGWSTIIILLVLLLLLFDNQNHCTYECMVPAIRFSYER